MKRSLGTALAVLAASMLAACSSSGGPASGSASHSAGSPPVGSASTPASGSAKPGGVVTTVHVALIPSAVKAPFYLALEKGFFSSRGLNVVPVPMQNGAAVTAAVTSGNAQIGSQALSPAVTAVAKGVPIVAFAGDESASRPASSTAPYGDVVVLVGKNSPIKTAADLNGRTVAVNALRAGVELALRGAVDNAGGDSSTLKLLPMPFPDMLSALTNHRVEAIAALEPFVHTAVDTGARVLLDAFPYGPKEKSDFLASIWFTSTNYAKANSDVLTKYRAALADADAYVKQNPSEVARIVPTFTKITAADAAKLWKADWSAEIDPDAYNAAIDLMTKYKFIDEQLPLSKFATADSAS